MRVHIDPDDIAAEIDGAELAAHRYRRNAAEARQEGDPSRLRYSADAAGRSLAARRLLRELAR